MHLLYAYLFPLLWIAYIVYWQAMAGDVKATRSEEAASSRVSRSLVFLLALVLLLSPRLPLPFLYWQVLPGGMSTFFIGAAITTAGLLFSIWARRQLGRNWSRSVTIKQDHELIVTGPYKWVRHPIYTGLLGGFLGSAVAIAEVRGFLAFFVIFVSLWAKLRTEERFMHHEFGESYDAYKRRVPALVPFVL